MPFHVNRSVGQATTIESSKGPMEGCYVLCGYQPRTHRNRAPFPETMSYNPTVRSKLYCSLGKVVIHAEQWVKCKSAKEPRPRGDNPARTRAIYRAEHAGA